MRKLLVTKDRCFDSDFIETHYCKSSDLTFITYEANNKTEVVGFYWGEPNDYLTEHFIGQLIAEYSEEE